MEKEQYRAAKARLVAHMQAGQTWQAAAATAGVQTSQSTAYRLLQIVQKQGEAALQDMRHGHPSKLCGEVRTFLEYQCREAPSTPSSTIQAVLQERFDLSVSVSQINRVRAELGVGNRPQNQQQGKKPLGWQAYLDVRSFTGKTKGDFTLISRQVCHPRFFCTVGKSPIEIA